MPKTKQKRAVSQATLNRLREMRRKYGLGEFKAGGAKRSRSRPSTRVRTRTRSGRSPRARASRPSSALSVFAPLSAIGFPGVVSGSASRPFLGATPVQSSQGGNVFAPTPNPRAAGAKRPVS